MSFLGLRTHGQRDLAPSPPPLFPPRGATRGAESALYRRPFAPNRSAGERPAREVRRHRLPGLQLRPRRRASRWSSATGQRPHRHALARTALPDVGLDRPAGRVFLWRLLRCGAIAAHSAGHGPEVAGAAARKGGGAGHLQRLSGADRIRAAARRAAAQRDAAYICKDVDLEASRRTDSVSPRHYEPRPGGVPIAHGDGNYFLDEDGRARLEDEERIAFRYCDGLAR